MLRLGQRALPVEAIRGFVGSVETDTDKRPALATFSIFSLVAAILIIGVLDIGWRARVIAGAVLFAGIALSALHDLVWLTRPGIYRVEVLTSGGETVRFSTIDPVEHAALLHALTGVVARNLANPTLHEVAEEMRAALARTAPPPKAGPSDRVAVA